LISQPPELRLLTGVCAGIALASTLLKAGKESFASFHNQTAV